MMRRWAWRAQLRGRTSRLPNPLMHPTNAGDAQSPTASAPLAAIGPPLGAITYSGFDPAVQRDL